MITVAILLFDSHCSAIDVAGVVVVARVADVQASTTATSDDSKTNRISDDNKTNRIRGSRRCPPSLP